MDSHTLVKETKRLLINNKQRFIRFGLLFILMLFAVQMIPAVMQLFQTPGSETEELPTDIGSTENPAVFEMYIEYESGSVYTNTLLLEQALKSEENIQAAEEATGVEISDLLALEEEAEYPKTSRDRGALRATRNELSNIWVVIARVGTEEENLRVAEFFYDLVVNDEIEILENKPNYIMSGPRVLTDEELANPNTIVDMETVVSPFSIRNILSSLIVALAGGFLLTFVFIISLTFLNKKISYAFNYNWNENDLFVLLEEEQHEKTLERVVRLPESRSRLLLAQEAEGLPGWEEAAHVRVAEDVLDVDVTTDVEEIILFIQPGITDKKWYNQQRELLKVYRAPVKIIQLNSTQA